MKVREFVEAGTAINQYYVKDFDTKKIYLEDSDKWSVQLSEYADYDVVYWKADSQFGIIIECRKEEEFQSMKECIDEFFEFVDEMGMSRMI